MPRVDMFAINCLILSLIVGPTACYRQSLGPSDAQQVAFGGPVHVRNFGIWHRSHAVNLSEFRGNRVHLRSFPHIKGKGISVKWADLEPRRGEFDFNAIDNALSEAGESNVGFYCMVLPGPDAPQWIYAEDPKVPKVFTIDDTGKHARMNESGFPYYLDATYQKHFFNMISALGAFLRSHLHVRNIAFVQANYGCRGDPTLYNGRPTDPKFYISKEDEVKFMKSTWMKYKEAFQTGKGSVIPILVNGWTSGPDSQSFALETISPLGIKGAAMVRGHHFNGERTWIERHQKYMLNPRDGSSTPFLFTRCQMDQAWKKPFYQLNLQLGFYWGVLNGLNQGLSYFDVSKDVLKSAEELGFLDSLLFFNKYAGQIWPHNSSHAFIALHLGLDAADFDTYPVEKYGREVSTRLATICEEYKQFGCKMDDPLAATKGQEYQRDNQKGYNDVGWDIWPTNYARWLEQIDADETSQGLFRIGGELNSKSSQYARFARGLRHKAGKTGMYFKFHDEFLKGRAVGFLYFRIVWYDIRRGEWQLEYKSKQGHPRIAFHLPTQGDGAWKETSIILADAMIDHSLERGADFVISSRNSTDVVFHLIEVQRTERFPNSW